MVLSRGIHPGWGFEDGSGCRKGGDGRCSPPEREEVGQGRATGAVKVGRRQGGQDCMMGIYETTCSFGQSWEVERTRRRGSRVPRIPGCLA